MRARTHINPLNDLNQTARSYIGRPDAPANENWSQRRRRLCVATDRGNLLGGGLALAGRDSAPRSRASSRCGVSSHWNGIRAFPWCFRHFSTSHPILVSAYRVLDLFFEVVSRTCILKWFLYRPTLFIGLS